MLGISSCDSVDTDRSQRTAADGNNHVLSALVVLTPVLSLSLICHVSVFFHMYVEHVGFSVSILFPLSRTLFCFQFCHLCLSACVSYFCTTESSFCIWQTRCLFRADKWASALPYSWYPCFALLRWGILTDMLKHLPFIQRVPRCLQPCDPWQSKVEKMLLNAAFCVLHFLRVKSGLHHLWEGTARVSRVSAAGGNLITCH